MGDPTTITLSVTAFLGIIFGIINLLVLGPVAWILKNAISDIRDLQNDHESFKEKILTEYIHTNTYERDIKEVKETLKEISRKLDDKADK